MDPNAYKLIEAYVRSFENVAQIIKERNPDIIVAPMMGAVPFVDTLCIIDPDFPNEKVVYVPASNKVHRMREVLRAAFGKLISDRAPEGGQFLSLDEVVSGNSAQRVYKQFNAARMEYANKKTVDLFGERTDFRKDNVSAFRDSVVDSIDYRTIGIVDTRMDRGGKPKVSEYEELVAEGIVIPVEIPCIVTMDRPAFFPVSYKVERDSDGRTYFLPVVSEFRISKEYVEFLRTVAAIIGKDPEDVTFQNLARIQSANDLIPNRLKHI